MVSIDGRVVDSADAQVSVFDRGFLYGDSVFEVYRTYGGVPFAEKAHLERLARSAERLMIAMPVSLDTLSTEVRATLDAAGEGEWYVRVVVTRGSGPLTYDPSTATTPLRVVIVAPLTLPSHSSIMTGLYPPRHGVRDSIGRLPPTLHSGRYLRSYVPFR